MGSYKDVGEILPFMTPRDWEREQRLVKRLFDHLRGEGRNEELLGIPFYVAFIHTAEGPKILENNSRPGDPEIINILPLLKDDFVEVCFKMLEGRLTRVEVEQAASVVTYKVPPNYGGFEKVYPQRVRRSEVGGPVDFSGVCRLMERYRDRMRVYPASMELREGGVYPLRSRAICVVGIGESVEEARSISLEGIKAIRGGALWYRGDIASKEHIDRSIRNMKELRGG
jgi:phosphoribosylamine--glycine ligase